MYKFCEIGFANERKLNVFHQVFLYQHLQPVKDKAFGHESDIWFITGRTISFEQYFQIELRWNLNIATGETSQAITPFHFFDNFNFHH